MLAAMTSEIKAPFLLTAGQYALPENCITEVVATTGSTNSDLLARARAAALPLASSGRVMIRIAHTQHAGRGRQGRAWLAASGASFLMSAAVVRSETAQQLGTVTLELGIAAAQVLLQHGISAQLKWPNDLFLNGQKLAGILVESVNTPNGIALVAGIGVNGVMDESARAACGQPVAALADAVALTPHTAAQIGRDVACAFAQTLCATAFGANDLPARFAQFDALRGQEVALHCAGQPATPGVALGIDTAGRLLVQQDTGLRHYSSGEVSLRLR